MSKKTHKLSVGSGPHKTPGVSLKAKSPGPKKVSSSSPSLSSSSSICKLRSVPLFPPKGGVDGPPSAVSMSANPRYSFSSSGDKLRVRFFSSLTDVGTNDVIGAGYQSGFNLAATSSSFSAATYAPITTLALNPCRMAGAVSTVLSWAAFDCFPNSSYLSIIASGFSRWRYASSTTFHFQPMAPTSTTVDFTFTYTQDPYHPILGFRAYENGNYPSESTLQTGSYSVSYAGWQPWSLTVPNDTNSVLYTYPLSNASTAMTDEQRLEFSGCISNIASTFSTGPVRYGRLWIETEIEFSDPSPISFFGFTPTLAKAVCNLLDHQEKSKNLVRRKMSSLPPPVPTPVPPESKEQKSQVWYESSDGVLFNEEDDSDVLPLMAPKLVWTVRVSRFDHRDDLRSSRLLPTVTPPPTPIPISVSSKPSSLSETTKK